jgi:phosphomethylpyrimidine synthase
MMTQLEAARSGRITKEMQQVALTEGISPEGLRASIANGSAIIPANVNHVNLKAVGIGLGLRTKVNANIGTSPDCPGLDLNRDKLRIALAAGADAIMDLSLAGDLREIRKAVVQDSPVPVGTVPMYEASAMSVRRTGELDSFTIDDLFKVIKQNAEDGVDFITVHCGVTQGAVERIRSEGRVTDIVSRGGSLLARWMVKHGKENPLYEYFDQLLQICQDRDVTLSLGDGLRPGSIADATDRGQVYELIMLGELTQRAWSAGVQVMIEGPGHVPMDQVAANVLLEKRLCHGAPFYVLGPLVTDVAPGYDHITSAIGGAMAAAAGADFLCYVTPAEHLCLPTAEHVREGVVAARIAAHAGDISKGINGARDWDREISVARKRLDWDAQIKLAIDGERASQLRNASLPKDSEVCTMCGEFCAMRVASQTL